jgi:hypothetical protein
MEIISSLFFFFLHLDAFAPDTHSVGLSSGRGPVGEALGRVLGETEGDSIRNAEFLGDWDKKGDPSRGKGGDGKGRRGFNGGVEVSDGDASSRRQLEVELLLDSPFVCLIDVALTSDFCRELSMLARMLVE